MNLDSLLGRSVYLDTNVFIYFVEGHARLGAPLRDLFDHIATGRIRAVTSELTLAEVLVKPISERRETVATTYRELLKEGSAIEVEPIARAILERSAEIRAHHTLRAFDAIHVATAVEKRCDLVISEDARLKAPGDLTHVRISQLDIRGGA